MLFRSYRKAAEQDLADAQFNLGLMYEGGRGVEQDNAKAAEFYCKAAEQGVVDAQFNLGLMCADGKGVGQGSARGTYKFPSSPTNATERIRSAST